jgi:glutamine amidotransferase
MKIAIIDYGAGNLRSVARAVAHVGYEGRVTSDPRDVDAADKVIMPGVGAAADTMRNLRICGMVEPVRAYIASGRPFFGVCMGQQALLSVSEEGGQHECLGIIPGRVVRLPRGEKEEESRGRGGGEGEAQSAEGKEDSKQQTAKSKDGGERKDERANASALNGQGSRLKVPHMGWNRVRQVREHAIFEGIEDGAYFYFVHSYYPAPREPALTAATAVYGRPFTCAIARDNIFAVQFHPEKSQSAGLQLLSNFVRWRP